MIICQKCGYDNPMTTVFCRSCGARLEFNPNQLGQSIQQDNAAKRDRDVLGWGRSAISLCVFALVVALVLRFIAMPTAPTGDVPHANDLALFASNPSWATAPLAGPQAGSLDDLVAGTDRLRWRAQVGGGILSAFSIDLAPLNAAQDALLAAQRPDGSFGGESGDGVNDLAATGLAALGLQAWPRDPRHLAAAAAARSWIDAQWRRLSSAPPTAKALAIGAMIDAEALSDRRRAELGALLVDGSSPLWQALALPGLIGKARPTQTVALRNKLTAEHWPVYFDLLAGAPLAQAPLRLWFSEYGTSLPTAEARASWLLLSWQHARAPNDLSECLRTWTSAATIPADPETLRLAGATVTEPALRLLLAGTPFRVPALQLSR